MGIRVTITAPGWAANQTTYYRTNDAQNPAQALVCTTQPTPGQTLSAASAILLLASRALVIWMRGTVLSFWIFLYSTNAALAFFAAAQNCRRLLSSLSTCFPHHRFKEGE